MEGLRFSPTLEPLYDIFDAEKNYNQALEARAQATAARRRAYDEYIEAGTNELDYREMYGADNSETYNTLLTNYERASNSYNLARARLDEIMRIINQLS